MMTPSKIYVLYLLPSRPDFSITMTEQERSVMGEHIAYWNAWLKKGKVYAFGPVMDPKGVYGLGIVAAENEEELKTLIENDPASKINRYEYYPMMAVVPELQINPR